VQLFDEENQDTGTAGGSGGGFPTPPDIGSPGLGGDVALPPIALPENPFPGAPTVEPPASPTIPGESPTGTGTTSGEEPPAGTGTVEPMPPGAPGSPENPIQVTGTAPQLPPGPKNPTAPALPAPVKVSQTATESGTATATAIATASIDQNIQIMNQDVQPLADAVTNGIADAAKKASDIAQNAAQQISTSINGYSNALFGWIKDIGAWLRDNIGTILNDVVKGVEKIGTTIYNAVKGALDSISNVVTNTIVPVLEKIGTAVKNIADFYAQHIQPILATIAQIQSTVAAAIVAIEKDVQSGLSGILHLPTDLANAFSSIDQALIRAGRALQVKKADDADYYVITPDGTGFAEHIKNLGSAVAGLAPNMVKTTYSPGHETLSEPTLAAVLPELLHTVNTLAMDLAKGIKNLASSPGDVVETVGIVGLSIWAGWFEPVVLLYFLLEVLKQPLNTIGEVTDQRVKSQIPLKKLDPDTLAQAWKRNLLDADAMDAEMSVQGYDKNRSDLLRRLTRHVVPDETLVDYHYRGMVSDGDLAAGLSDLGYTDAQQRALLEGSMRLLDVATALQAWHRGIIDEDQVDQTIKVNRFDDAQAELIKGLSLRPPSYQEMYGAYLQDRLLTLILGVTPVYDTLPNEVKAAGEANGMSKDAVLTAWTSELNTLASTQWLQLYWRGQASIGELNNALFRDRVPEPLWPNWIDSQRPLIPFRTIPSMVANHIMSESDALAYLQKHGYALDDAVKLVQYASRGAKVKAATTAVTQHGFSLATAKTAYNDGLMSDDQYVALLEAHGFTKDEAALDLQVTKLDQEIKSRKQLGADIVNEYQAGLIDQAAALQTLANSGFTLAEQAAVERKLRSSAGVKAKMPSEAELRNMAKNDVITLDDYETTLVTIGYPDVWAKRFRDLYFPPAAPAPAAPAAP
jgi:hypothetical protein